MKKYTNISMKTKEICFIKTLKIKFKKSLSKIRVIQMIYET